MAKTVNKGVNLELEAQLLSGVSESSGEPQPLDPPSLSLLGQMYLTLSKEAQESKAYKLSECQHEDINRPSEFKADDEADSDSPAQRRALQEAFSSLGEFPALVDKTRHIGTLAVDEKIGANNEPRDSTGAITPAKESYARRMIGDLDDSADALLSLHKREANLQSHDEARIQSLKDDMYGALIFVHLPISLQPPSIRKLGKLLRASVRGIG
jgi:hypothetical protein